MSRLRTTRRTVVGTLLLLLLGSQMVLAVSHNAPSKYGATFYHWRNMYQSLPPENIYPPTINWNINDQAWWNQVVAQAREAGLGWFAVNAWGEGTDADPLFLSELITAINAHDGQLKLALFDDTTSEVLRKNLARGHGWSLSPPFDLADSNGVGEGGWFYFYDQQWKRYFQAVPDQYRLKVNGRPVVFMWHGGAEWYTNHSAFSDMIAALRAAVQSDFGVDPYIIAEESWRGLDADVALDTVYDWFEPNVKPVTMTGINGVTVSNIIPGYDGSLFNPPRAVQDRQGGALYDWNMDQIASWADLVMIESIVNVEENAHLIETTTWGRQYLELTAWYAQNRP